MPLRALTCLSVMTLGLCCCVTASAASREVGPGMPLVIPIGDVIGGTDAKNNAKNNPNGGYLSVYDTISQFSYPNTHGNQLGSTAIVNDHIYWDSSPGGLDATHAPHPDAGGGSALWWPIPGEWMSYQFTVTTPGTFTVLTRFSSSWGPGQPAQISLTIDGVSSGPVPLAPDDAKLWSDTHFQVGGWWGHTMVSGTCPVGWTLGAGTHVLRVQMERFPDKPMDHGNVWIHYVKIITAANAAKMPTTVLKPVVPRQVAAATAALKQAAEHEQKGRLGQALTAYEKAVAGFPPGSEQLDRASEKAKELRAVGEQRLTAAKALPEAEAQPALAKLAEEFSGCDVGTLASKAVSAAAAAAPAASVTTTAANAVLPSAGWTPPPREQAVAALKTLVIATLVKDQLEVPLTLFGKPQQVVVSGGTERGLMVKLAGSSAGLDLPWERLSLADLASLGRACIKGRAERALLVGENSIACDQKQLADEVLHLAARLDSTLNMAVAQRLAAIPSH